MQSYTRTHPENGCCLYGRGLGVGISTVPGPAWYVHADILSFVAHSSPGGGTMNQVVSVVAASVTARSPVIPTAGRLTMCGALRVTA